MTGSTIALQYAALHQKDPEVIKSIITMLHTDILCNILAVHGVLHIAAFKNPNAGIVEAFLFNMKWPMVDWLIHQKVATPEFGH